MTMEKYIRVIAGTFILISVALAIWVSPWWLIWTAFVGLNLIQSAFTNWCLAEKILKKLGVPGEKEFDGKGVVYCSTCDAPLFKDAAVAVVGGGNSALDACLQLAKIAKKVYVIDVASGFKADPALAKIALRMGLSLTAVKSRVRRGRAMLKKKLRCYY